MTSAEYRDPLEEINNSIVSCVQAVRTNIDDLEAAEDMLLCTVCPRLEKQHHATLGGAFAGSYKAYKDPMEVCLVDARNPLRKAMNNISFKATQGVYGAKKDIDGDLIHFTQTYVAYYEGSEALCTTVRTTIETALGESIFRTDEELRDTWESIVGARQHIKTYLDSFNIFRNALPE